MCYDVLYLKISEHLIYSLILKNKKSRNYIIQTVTNFMMFELYNRFLKIIIT